MSALLGVKFVHDTCTCWLTRLLVWLTVTVLALGFGPPFPPFSDGSHMCGPVTVAAE